MPALIMQLTGEHLDAAARYGGWLGFVFAAVQFFCAPLLGNLSDRYGRRPVLLFSLFAADSADGSGRAARRTGKRLEPVLDHWAAGDDAAVRTFRECRGAGAISRCALHCCGATGDVQCDDTCARRHHRGECVCSDRSRRIAAQKAAGLRERFPSFGYPAVHQLPDMRDRGPHLQFNLGARRLCAFGKPS